MSDTPSRRLLLARLGGASVAGLGLAGCLGDDSDGADDGEDHEEPSERPDGLGADGIDLAVLQGTVEEILDEGAFVYEGFGEHLNVGGEIQEAEAIRLAADNGASRGFIVVGENPGQLEDPLHAPRVEMFYAEGAEAYEVEDFGTPEAVDESFEKVVATANDHLDEVLERVTQVDWGAPSWDAQAGVYVVPPDDLSDTQPPITEAELRVNADGVPVGVAGTIDRPPGRSSVDVHFTPDADVERPEWVEEAF